MRSGISLHGLNLRSTYPPTKPTDNDGCSRHKQGQDKMKQWMPIPVEVIEAVDNERRLFDCQASTLDGFAYAWLKSHRGAPLSQRQLAAWAGWSKRKAAAVLNAVQEAQDQWADQKRTKNAPAAATQNGPAHANDSDNLRHDADHERTRNGPVSDQKRTDRARSLYRNTTDPQVQDLIDVETSSDTTTILDGNEGSFQPVLSDSDTDGQAPSACKQSPSPRKGATRGKNIGTVEVRQLWEALNDKRKQWKQGARSLKLTPQIASALVEALRYATPAEVLHAYDWYTTAKAARWWQDHGCDLVTFCRKKHLGEFINKAGEWSVEIERQQEEIDDLPF